MNATKLPSGSWRVRVLVGKDPDGKRHYRSFTCDDTSRKGKATCERMALDFLLQKESEEPIPGELPLSEALEEYIRVRRPVLSPSTIRGYVNLSSRLVALYPIFFSLNVYRVATEDVQVFVNEYTVGRSPKSVRNAYGLITACIHHFNSSTTIRCVLPQRVKPKLYIPTDEDIRRLMYHIKGTELEIPVLLAAFGCMRRSEIAALTLSDIDEDGVAHVCKAIVKDDEEEWTQKTTKTVSSDRYVLLPEFLVKKIRKKGYITSYNADTITHRFGRVLDKTSIPHFRFHDLRHYSASIMHALGVPDAYIMQRGGWSTDTVLKDVYRHALDDKQRRMNEKVNSYFENFY